MRFSEIADHIANRGFVTRELWEDEVVLYWGTDNLPQLARKDGSKFNWHPTLEAIDANDYIILPYFWNGPKDDMRPFEKGM
ncbi:unnamed protein product [marine sediment metagenome]|uniref:Uncharacterized protein n=1 Tax=marine sediment metagenome TaxID=412755 RepID=X0SAB1_9ZZZZ